MASNDLILSEQHRQMLEVDSGISPDVIQARGYRTVTADEARKYGFTGHQARAGLLFPVCPPDGSNGLYMLRPDSPRVIEEKKKGKLPDGTYPNKVIKYEWPEGKGLRVDLPPICRPMMGDITRPVFITEGVKKGDSLASHLVTLGYCVLDFPGGVWGFKDGEGISADLDGLAWRNREVFVVYDSDILTKEAVAKALTRLSTILGRKGARVSAVPLPARKGEKVGVDDFLAKYGTVDDLLHFAEMGKLLPLKVTDRADNAPKSAEYLEALAELGYMFTLDDTTDTVLVNGQPITDVTEAEIKTRMRDNGYKEVNVISDAYLAFAGRKRVHPIRDYLTSLEWDGQDHIGALAGYFQDAHAAEFKQIYQDTGESYAGSEVFYAWLKRWLVGAVAKAFDQKQNVMLVLDGPQDIGKSYFVQWLGGVLPDNFIEAPINPEDKDVYVRLISKFVWEVAELGATTRRADREALKDFITKRTVTVRKAYGKYDTTKPALASLIGTINNEAGFLTDPTGNRRYLTCKLIGINWDYCKGIDPGKVWAQALALYRKGEPCRLIPKEAQLQRLINDGYMVEAPLKGVLTKYFDINPNLDIWTPAMDIVTHLESMGLKGHQNQNLKDLAIVMSELGVEKRRVGRAKVVSYKGITLLKSEDK